MSSSPPDRRKISIYYDAETHAYWTKTPDGWVSMCETSALRHLRDSGIGPEPIQGTYLTRLDAQLIDIQRNFHIHYAGPVAGYDEGLYDSYGYKLLVTRSPRLLVPSEGDWPIWEACLETMYRRKHPLQIPTLHSYNKVSMECLYSRKFKPGQMKFSFGENNSGKSFEQNRVTNFYGGRAADPWRYMTGKTEFNGDLIGAEHLLVSDPDVNSIKDKLDFAARIKQFTVNELQSYHRKNLEAIPVRPFWRVDVSANSETHNASIVTVTDPSVLEKVMLFLVSPDSIPPEKYRDLPYDEFCRRVDAELPHYVWFLLNQWKIPVELVSRRFGVKAFHHPEILENITDLAIETRLCYLLDSNPYFFNSGPWEDTAEALQKWLHAQASDSPDARKFSQSKNLIINCLSKLAQQHPERFIKMRSKDRRWWKICPSRIDLENRQ